MINVSKIEKIQSEKVMYNFVNMDRKQTYFLHHIIRFFVKRFIQSSLVGDRSTICGTPLPLLLASLTHVTVMPMEFYKTLQDFYIFIGLLWDFSKIL